MIFLRRLPGLWVGALLYSFRESMFTSPRENLLVGGIFLFFQVIESPRLRLMCWSEM